MGMLLNRLVMVAGMGLVISLGSDAPGADIIVESRAEGQNHAGYKEIEGDWKSSQYPPAASKSSAAGATASARCGSRKYKFSEEGQAGAARPAAARFSPRLQQPGRFYVYVTWPSGANAAPVTYTVKHAGGEDRKQLVQDGPGGRGGAGNGNEWILLSDYDFMPGDDQYVEVRTDTDCAPVARNSAGQVFADAVRFSTVPLDTRLPATPAATPKPTATPEPTATPAPQNTPAPPSATGPGLQWQEDLDSALKKAAAERKRILIHFAAPEARTSRCQEEKILASEVIQRELAWRYVMVRLDISRDSALASKLGVLRGGTIVLCSRTGDPFARITDCPEPHEFLAKLK